jgi:CDP-diacylglycerol--glycerol-3-phosphate 3-phosphatidyltransferase
MANNWKDEGQKMVYGVINPFINLLVKCGITPNMITFFGLILNLLASVVLIYGAEKGERMDHRYVGLAGFIILLGGLMDMVDGRLARVANLSSDYGALFDSVLDRYSEMVMFLGICYYLVSYDYFLSSLFAFIAMIGSVMVSYTRARAEGLGVSASVGIMQRPERILLIGVAALACGIFSNIFGGDYKIDMEGLPFPLFETITIFTLPIFVLAIMANITALRRLFHARKIILKS